MFAQSKAVALNIWKKYSMATHLELLYVFLQPLSGSRQTCWELLISKGYVYRKIIYGKIQAEFF